MADVLFDARTTQTGAGVTSLTGDHVPVDTPTVVTVSVSMGVFADTVSTITYGGTSMTLIGRIDRGVGNALVMELWGLANPPPGTRSVVVTFTASVDNAGVVRQSYTGSATASAFGTIQTSSGTGTTTTTPAVTSAAGELVVDALTTPQDVGAPTVGAGQINANTLTVNTAHWNSTSDEAGAASVTMSWTQTSERFVHIAVPIKLPVATINLWLQPISVPVLPKHEIIGY